VSFFLSAQPWLGLLSLARSVYSFTIVGPGVPVAALSFMANLPPRALFLSGHVSHRLLHQSQTSELAEFASLSAVVVKTDASTNVGDVAGRAAAVSSSSGADSLPIPVSSTGASSSRKWMFVATAAIGTAIGIYWWRR
jgi:hypothetical protein